jgi:hypothetical protein
MVFVNVMMQQTTGLVQLVSLKKLINKFAILIINVLHCKCFTVILVRHFAYVIVVDIGINLLVFQKDQLIKDAIQILNA